MGKNALVIGVSRVGGSVADGEEPPVGARIWTPLDFVPERVDAAAKALQDHGYEVGTLSEPDRTRLHRLGDFVTDRPGRRIVHIIGHGDLDETTRELHLVPANGKFGVSTSLKGLVTVAAAECRASPDDQVLLLLDLCHAGAAFDELTHSQTRKVWALAACTPDETTSFGHFSQAFTEVLDRVRADGLGTDARHRYVSMDRLRTAVGARFRELAGNAPFFEASGMFGQDRPGHFFTNPNFEADAVTVAEAKASVDTALHPYLDAPHFTGRVGEHFTGRHSLLTRLRDWCEHADSALRIVTGSAGSGKSTVMGALVLATHPVLRAHPVYGEACRRLWPEPWSAGPVAVVHARQRRLDEIAEALTGQLDVGESRLDLLEALGAQAVPPLIIIDALDEAIDPASVVSVLLRALATAKRGDGSPLCRLLVAVRNTDPEHRELIRRLTEGADSVTHDLDATDRVELRDDLTAYLSARLTESEHYRENPDLTTRLAEGTATRLVASSTRTHGEFLVAALYARFLIDSPVDERGLVRALDRVPLTLPDVLELDLSTRAGTDARQRRAILAATAHARGQGMPAELIRQLVESRFLGEPVPDVTARLRGSDQVKVYLRTDIDTDGTTLYRLFHQGLVDYLRRHPMESP